MVKSQKGEDVVLMGVVMSLIIIGLFMIYSASSFRAEIKYGNPQLFFIQHLKHVVIGLLVMTGISRIDYHKLRPFVPFVFLLLIFLLIMVLMGPQNAGSRRSFYNYGQPSEFMKLTVVFYLASVFSYASDNEVDQQNAVSHYVFLVAVVLLVFFAPDLGTSIVIFLTGLVMFFLGGVKWRIFYRMLFPVIPTVMAGILFFPHQRQRMVDFIQSVFSDGPMSYQVRQSVIGLAQGGFAGVGYGAGKQKMLFLPEPFSDFILASYGEELGFIGMVILCGLLLMLLWRGMRIAKNAPDSYGAMLAAGIVSMILINALVNAGVAVNLLPTTGLPFPFLSYGGSSLIVQMTGVGVLLNISMARPLSYKRFTVNRAQRIKWQAGV